MPKSSGIAGTPFWKSVVDGTRQGWIYLGMIAFGALLVLLGLAVVARKGAPGWIEVVIGLGLIATPILRTARSRRIVRDREEKERAEREATERRHREMLSAYTAALERARTDPNDISLSAVARERERLELPYDVWCTYAWHTVLDIGFAALARVGPTRAAEVNDLMKRASAAVGLAPRDELLVRIGLYRVVAWHLLADDRMNETQLEALHAVRRGLDIRESDVPAEDLAGAQFTRLRGITPTDLPREEPGFPLGFHEYCVRVAKGTQMKKVKEKIDHRKVEKIVPDEACTLFVTNKRLIVDGKKRIEVPLPKVDDVEYDVESNVLTVRTARTMKNLYLQLDEPLYTGALIELVLGIDERPRGFA